jgi:hypothetical protein
VRQSVRLATIAGIRVAVQFGGRVFGIGRALNEQHRQV